MIDSGDKKTWEVGGLFEGKASEMMQKTRQVRNEKLSSVITQHG